MIFFSLEFEYELLGNELADMEWETFQGVLTISTAGTPSSFWACSWKLLTRCQWFLQAWAGGATELQRGNINCNGFRRILARNSYFETYLNSEERYLVSSSNDHCKLEWKTWGKHLKFGWKWLCGLWHFGFVSSQFKAKLNLHVTKPRRKALHCVRGVCETQTLFACLCP